MKLGLIYLPFIGVFIFGLVLVANPYLESILYVCVRYPYRTECYTEVIRSFSLPLLLNGILLIVTSIINTIVLTGVILVLRNQKKRRKSIADGVNNM